MKVYIPENYIKLFAKHGMIYVYDAEIPGYTPFTFYTSEDRKALLPIYGAVGKIQGTIMALTSILDISEENVNRIYDHLNEILKTLDNL